MVEDEKLDVQFSSSFFVFKEAPFKRNPRKTSKKEWFESA
jgi:hypothetical protein